MSDTMLATLGCDVYYKLNLGAAEPHAAAVRVLVHVYNICLYVYLVCVHAIDMRLHGLTVASTCIR